MPLPPISPPLLNSANPWCTFEADLTALYNCPHTGAVTTRTSLLHGFPHDPSIHQHVFFSPSTQTTSSAPDYSLTNTHDFPSSLNTLGYSPIPLPTYLSWISRIFLASPTQTPKPFIVSITGTPIEISQSYMLIHNLALSHPTLPLAVEINLSCPNIANKPPPAYSSTALTEYLSELSKVPRGKVALGLKTPPYTYAGQFEELIQSLKFAAEVSTPIDFITATNTLGSCLVLAENQTPVLGSVTGMGIGGLAGEALHPLALGNVATLRKMLDQVPELKEVDIIGVGGVGNSGGFGRMKAVGAKVVGVGTAFGREGLDVFAKILKVE